MLRQKKHIIFFALLTLLLIGKTAEAQPSHKNYEVEARAHYGYLFFQRDKYHQALRRYEMFAPAYEFSVHRNTYGQHRWEVLHNYPSYGLTFYYSGFRNDEVSKELGKVFALYPFISFSRIQKGFDKLAIKMGVGLSYFTNKYDPKENWYNYAIGSHLNLAVNLSVEYRKKILNRLSSVTTLGLTHFSNGSLCTPNYGINILSAATGFSWFLNQPKTPIDKKLRSKLRLFEFDGKRYCFTDVQFTLGYKDMSQQLGSHDQYFIYNMTGNFLFPVSECDRLGIGIEAIKDNSGKALNEGWDKEYYFMKAGVMLSYETEFDQISFLFNLGYRIEDFHFIDEFRKAEKFKDKLKTIPTQFYQKASIRYYLSDNLFATFSFTTYDIKADFLSIGIGYRFYHNYHLSTYEKKTKYSPVFPR